MQPYEEEYERHYREEEEFGAEEHREEWVPESLESPFSEEEEVQLATELLGVTSEEELEEFLGKWLKAAANKAKGFLRSSVGKQLGGILKNVAKQALPAIGGAIGSAIAPGLGTVAGTKVGSWASNLFEVEGEGLDHEEYEFETARRFVALSGAAARNAAFGSRRAAPRSLAQQSAHSAARRYAPGVARRFRAFSTPAPWYWPAPVPACVQEPAAAPDASAAPAAKEEWGSSRGLEEWGHGEEQREEWGRREEQSEFGEEHGWGRREERPELGEERGWGRREEEEEGEEEEWGRAEEEKRAQEEGWGHSEGMHQGGRARSGRWVRQGRKIVIMGA